MSSISYLPNVSPKNNNTQQIRRRYNEVVSQVSQQVGAIATGTGDLGTLHNNVQTLNTTKAPVASPSFTGTVTQPSPPVLTAATTATTATAGAASALPATPLGYLQTSVNGVQVKIPYYAV